MNAHRWTMENLAWYVNGTLAGSDLERLESHLGGCLVCQQEWRAQQRIAAAVAAPALLPSPDQSLAALDERIAAADRSRRSLPRRLRDMLSATPRPMRVALLAQSLALALLLSLLIVQRPGEPAGGEFRTLSAEPPVAGDVRVLFAGDLTREQVIGLAQGWRARVVAGPTGRGVYTLELEGAATDARVAAIRAHGSVVFAERPAGAAAEDR